MGAVKGKVSGADMDLVEAEAKRLVKETGAFFLNQFENADNSLAQQKAAQEMWEQTDGQIQAFADFIGTGGTFSGYAAALKNLDPSVKCYAVEPYGCAFYKDEIIEGSSHGIQGGGYAKEMILVKRSLLDGAVSVTDEEAVGMTKLISRKEGIFAGYSSGANVAAAVKLLQGTERGKNIGVVINDCGLKYMSTSLWKD